MDNQLSLVKPTVDLKQEYMSFYKEWIASGEKMVPWVIKKDPSDFDAMVHNLRLSERGENLPDGWVPDSTYWLINTERKIIGVVNLRHQLTTALRESGGHIGYGIRPSERGKGYAVHMLKLSLEKARGWGINRALLVCDDWNTASYRTIVKAGGQPEEDFIEKDGNLLKRFWFDLA